MRAAQNGKHVLCEKPIAASPDEAREMIAAAETYGVKLMEGFMYRFHPRIERVRQLLAEGAGKQEERPIQGPIPRRGRKALSGTADPRGTMAARCSASKRHTLVPDEPTLPQLVVVQ